MLFQLAFRLNKQCLINGFGTHPHSLVIRVQLTQPPGNKALVTSAVPASARLPRPVLGWRRFCVASGGSVLSTDIRCACWGIYNPKSSAWRVSSLLIVPGERPNRRAIARMLCPWFFISAMISRSLNGQKLGVDALVDPVLWDDLDRY